jgi:hypothetical protein
VSSNLTASAKTKNAAAPLQMEAVLRHFRFATEIRQTESNPVWLSPDQSD